MKGTRKGNLITGRYMITLTCITIAGCFLPLVLSSYMLRVMNIALISYMCVLSVYVLLGMCGQNSFAQAGFWGVGAYITANCLLKLNLGPIVSMIIAIAGTALFAFILGFAFFRLKQYYFTFATIGLMTIFNGLFLAQRTNTNSTVLYRRVLQECVAKFVIFFLHTRKNIFDMSKHWFINVIGDTT